MDSNHRTRREQIYSLLRLATSLSLHNKRWLGTESNRRHEDFQSSALPTELPSHTAYLINITYDTFIALIKNGGTDGI